MTCSTVHALSACALALALGMPASAQEPAPTATNAASSDSVRPLPVRPLGKITSNVSSYYPMSKATTQFAREGYIGQDAVVLYELPPKATLKLDLVSDSPCNIQMYAEGRGHRPTPVSGLSRRSFTLENRESVPQVIGVRINSRSLGASVGYTYAYTLNLTRSWDPAQFTAQSFKTNFTSAELAEIPEVSISDLEVASDPGPGTYPAEAIASRIQGTVVVDMVVSKEGRPVMVTVTEGPKELREFAEAYAWEWVFAPPRYKWKQRSVRLKLSIPYRLDIL